jgi:hypothetical protein
VAFAYIVVCMGKVESIFVFYFLVENKSRMHFFLLISPKLVESKIHKN